MKLLVLCPYPEGRAPSQRLKFEQYYDSWWEAGWTVDVRPFWDEEAWRILYRPRRWLRKGWKLALGYLRRRKDLRDALTADLVYIHLEAAPVGPPRLERRLRHAGRPLVYDIDDLIHLPHSSGSNAFMRWIRQKGKVPELIGMADEVIVCTSYLEGYARQHNARVTNISSTIDTVAYRPRPHRPLTEGVMIGWSGSHSTSPYLHLLDDVLRELQRTEGIRVRVIGDASFTTPALSLDATAWKLDTEVQDLSEIDVGVYPLPDEEWVLGKSGLKALQYMALEIPTVAQDTATNREIIRPGENGFLAATPEDWLRHLRALVHDPELRARIGREARRTVVERYSVSVTAPVYLRILEQARSRASAARRPGEASPAGRGEAPTPSGRDVPPPETGH